MANQQQALPQTNWANFNQHATNAQQARQGMVTELGLLQNALVAQAVQLLQQLRQMVGSVLIKLDVNDKMRGLESSIVLLLVCKSMPCFDLFSI